MPSNNKYLKPTGRPVKTCGNCFLLDRPSVPDPLVHHVIIWQRMSLSLPFLLLQADHLALVVNEIRLSVTVLPNGNYVITSYAAGAADPQAPKLIEVTPEKEVVWTYVDGKKQGIHHFQILDTDGESLKGIPLK